MRLTIFALEEPENHLSPYYLARIIGQVRSLTKNGGAQAILTSHAPAVLGRVYPKEVRYCRRDPATRISSIRSVKMPDGNQDAVKFVRGAMQAFPELYFARFVLLVEGESERIVLPRLAEAMGLLVDPSFVAIVPLGGRNVQHFWRLLNRLKIPFATLLDLDLGRKGGGFGRVKTAIQQLLEIGVPKEGLLELEDGSLLSDDDLDKLHTWQDSDRVENWLEGWIDGLNEHGVFFSSPLDFDLAMLEAFPEGEAIEQRLDEIAETIDSRADYCPNYKAVAGCLATIGHGGELRVEKGLVKPEDVAEAAAVRAASEDGASSSPAVKPPRAAPADPAAEARKRAGVGAGLADDLRAVRTGIVKMHLSRTRALPSRTASGRTRPTSTSPRRRANSGPGVP